MFKKLNIFGGSKKKKAVAAAAAANSSVDTVQKLRETEEIFIRKQAFLEEQIAEQLKIVLENCRTNKPMAKRALLKKKRLEKCLEVCSAQLTNLEVQRETLEAAKINTEVFKTMTGAAGALKTAHKALDVDKVHDIMDEIAEQHDLSQEITDAISKPMGSGHVDDDDLDKELDSMMQQELDTQLLDIGKKPLPATTGDDTSDEDKAQGPSSSHKPLGESKTNAQNSRKKTAAMTKQEEEDLRELEKWAAAAHQ